MRAPGYPWQCRQTRRARMQRARCKAKVVRREQARALRRWGLSVWGVPSGQVQRILGTREARFWAGPGETRVITVRVSEAGLLLSVQVQTAQGSVRPVSLRLPGVQRMDREGEWVVVRPDYAPIPLFGSEGLGDVVPSPGMCLSILDGDRVDVEVLNVGPEEARDLVIGLVYLPISEGEGRGRDSFGHGGERSGPRRSAQACVPLSQEGTPLSGRSTQTRI